MARREDQIEKDIGYLEELLPVSRKAMERQGPQRLDPSAHTQVLLATVA